MKYHSKNRADTKRGLSAIRCMLHAKKAFSLVESVTALIILALICSSVLVVFDRYIASAADLTLRTQAFEVARDNMETLLTQESVSEMTEYGTSENYPQIQWLTTVDSFYEPITSRMWIKDRTECPPP